MRYLKVSPPSRLSKPHPRHLPLTGCRSISICRPRFMWPANRSWRVGMQGEVRFWARFHPRAQHMPIRSRLLSVIDIETPIQCRHAQSRPRTVEIERPVCRYLSSTSCSYLHYFKIPHFNLTSNIRETLSTTILNEGSPHLYRSRSLYNGSYRRSIPDSRIEQRGKAY
jgi:hypothetical protein